MYICNECHRLFDDPKEVHTTYEKYYGIIDNASCSPFSYEVCPHCDNDYFEKLDLVTLKNNMFNITMHLQRYAEDKEVKWMKKDLQALEELIDAIEEIKY